jgi:ribosome-binding factor A
MNKSLPYNRAERVADAIYHLISEKMLSDISDPRLAGIQITKVEMTGDLRIARIYYHMFDASKEYKDKASQAFGSASSYFRRLIGELIQLKFTPELKFYYDASVDECERIDQLLSDIKGDDEHG